jgi:hypothetical protein
MFYKNFTILNYKAIDCIKIDLNSINLIPIIGLNETGKSSILEAIALFDYKNKYKNYSEIKNKFLNKELPIQILSEISMENIQNFNIDELTEIYIKKEIKIIINSISISSSVFLFDETDEEYVFQNLDDLFEKIKTIFEQLFNEITKSKNFLLTRIIIEEGDYYYSDISKIQEKEIIFNYMGNDIKFLVEEFKIKQYFFRYIVDTLPKIIYINDFNDKVPRNINIEEREWFNYIDEMFKKHTDINIEKFEKLLDKEQRTKLSKVSKKLNRNLLLKWEELHKNSQIKEDFENSEISLNYKDKYFTFSIADNRKIVIDEDGDKERETIHFDIDQRSKGFQWFFSFFIKLYYNFQHTDEEYQSIILLDEPGVYLHSDFQKELLNILKKVSNNNKVIYCTHLENLVNPNIIPIKTIKIATRENENIELKNYFEFSNNSRNLGDMTPLINALKLNSYPYNYFDKKILLVEGMTEVIFFKLLQEKKLLDKEIVIIPLGGASQISILISLISGLSKKYVLLLDSDNEGKKAYEKNKNMFGEYEAKNWILQKFENQEKNSLEDLYNENIRNILKEDIDYSEFNIKSIVINFYYESKNTPKRIKFLRELKKIYYEKTELYNLIKKINTILEINDTENRN